jgi:hypothetical protein
MKNTCRGIEASKHGLMLVHVQYKHICALPGQGSSLTRLPFHYGACTAPVGCVAGGVLLGFIGPLSCTHRTTLSGHYTHIVFALLLKSVLQLQRNAEVQLCWLLTVLNAQGTSQALKR